jgi:DNA-binding Xre family transcriptional regulator
MSHLQGGEIACDLRDLLFSSDIRLSTLARRIEEDRRRLVAWEKNSAERFHLDTLARLCAIFGGIPVQLILRFIPPPADSPGDLQADPQPPTRTIAVVRALPALPQPYGHIEFLWEQQGWSSRQLARETTLWKETLDDLTSNSSHAIARRTLVKLCCRLEGIENVMRFVPPGG